MPQADITKPIDLTGHSEGTGPDRHRQPVYMDLLPPCNSACPAVKTSRPGYRTPRLATITGPSIRS